MAKITANFTQAEFLPAKTETKWSDLTQRAKDMAKAMAEMLETIRAEARKEVANATIRVNSAIRPPLYNDKIGGSKTSDHLFGMIPASGYALSVGAADIVCPQMGTEKFFNMILKMRYDGKIKTGQLLLEKNNDFWVHIANDPAKFLTASQLAGRSEWSLRGVGYNLYNGKTGYWKTIAQGEFYGTADKIISKAGDLSPVELSTEQIKKIMIVGGAITICLATGVIYVSYKEKAKKNKKNEKKQ